MAEERLQKVLAAAGVASRRACEALIEQGRVQINGQPVTELGTKVDPELAQIAVDGKPIRMPKRHVYFKVHKPRGLLSDIGGDARGRGTVADLLPAEIRRVFPVGRLDLNSEGLMVLTDDGELAHRLTHPRFEHPKTYYALLAERPDAGALAQLRQGVELPEGRTAPASVSVVARLPHDLVLGPGPREGVWLEIVLREGKKRQIRHMTAAVGHPTLRLIRWAIGALTLGALAYGESKPLTRTELAQLRELQPPKIESAKSRRPITKAESKKRERAGARVRTDRRDTRSSLRRKQSDSFRSPRGSR
jgi:23S rRNA pseudouridine2605 synthase